MRPLLLEMNLVHVRVEVPSVRRPELAEVAGELLLLLLPALGGVHPGGRNHGGGHRFCKEKQVSIKAIFFVQA